MSCLMDSPKGLFVKLTLTVAGIIFWQLQKRACTWKYHKFGLRALGFGFRCCSLYAFGQGLRHEVTIYEDNCQEQRSSCRMHASHRG